MKKSVYRIYHEDGTGAFTDRFSRKAAIRTARKVGGKCIIKKYVFTSISKFYLDGEPIKWH